MSIRYRDRPIKIAGFFGQLSVLLWKNLLIFRRHYYTSFFEIILALSFISLLLLLRYMVDRFFLAEERNGIVNVYDFFQTSSTRYLILYYPNNNLIQTIVDDAINKIRISNKLINVTGILNEKQIIFKYVCRNH